MLLLKLLLWCDQSPCPLSVMLRLQAREYLYYKLFGAQYVTPVAVMTSDAKDNHARMLALFQQHNWFGRGKEAFRSASSHMHALLPSHSSAGIVCVMLLVWRLWFRPVMTASTAALLSAH